MSNIYIQEPPTNGKVLLSTSVGDIEIELWSREAPKACRNFVQLCLENYYNGTIFHRVMKDFIAQGGDPTGTGDGGESVYGKPFRDEIHTRLRFVRRGLVAMANAGKDDNTSQFFITLGPTQELQGKHTIFGKVAGETIYNAIKMNDLSTDGNDRPVDPPKIKRTEVLLNPFDDIAPRQTIEHEKNEPKKKKSKVKGKKDFKLLSFGAEAEEDEEETNEVVETMRTKGKSAHDLADDPRLSTLSGDLDVPVSASKATEEELASVKQKLQQYKQDEKPAAPSEKDTTPQTSKLEELKKESRDLKRELKGSKSKESEEQSPEAEKKVPEAVANFKKEREVYELNKKALPKKGEKSREEQTMAMLNKFKSKLTTVQQFSSRYGEKEADMNSSKQEDGEFESDDEGWMAHRLECGDAHSKVLDANVTDIDRYEIYDPRNPMTKRRNEEAKTEAKRKKMEKDQVM